MPGNGFVQTITAARSWLRVELRRRWQSLLLLTLLVAIAGATVMASVAGARRGASALARLQNGARPATAVVFANTPNFDWDRVRALPDVHGLSTFLMRYAIYFDGISHDIGVAGRSLDASLSGAFAPVDDQLFRTIEKPELIKGRLYDPARDDEVVVTPRFVDSTGKDVGDTLIVTLPSPAEVRAGLDATSPRLSGPRITMRIVGVARSPWFSDSINSPGGAVLSPGLIARHPVNTVGFAASPVNPSWINALVRLRNGAADLPRFRRSLAAVTGRGDIQVWNLPSRRAEQQHEISFEARCLLAFAAAVLIAALFTIGQAIARYTAGEVAELDALRGLGLTRSQQITLGSAAPVVAAAAGSLLAGAAAVVASRWFPIGTAAFVEPRPGTSIDWLVIALGVVGLTLAISATSVSSAWHAARRSGRAASTQHSSLVAAAARGGAPVPLLVGLRFALERGTGRAALPVRPALVGAVAGVLGIVAALTFANGVNDAADHPRRYGQTFDLGALAGVNTFNFFDPGRVVRTLAVRADVKGVADIRDAIATSATGSGSVVLFSQSSSPKPLEIVLTSGRPPEAANEVVLAPRSLATLHASVGSRIAFHGDRGTATYRVTGIGFVPQGGPNDVYADGGWVTARGYDRILRSFRTRFVAVAAAPGRDLAQLSRALAEQGNAVISAPDGAGLSFDPIQPPIEVLQLRQVRALPTVLGVFLAILAVAAIGHALATAVRRRAPELAVLRALGMTPRQCRTAVITQATVTALFGLLVGIPLGIALGRTVWRAVADYTPLQYVAPAAAWIMAIAIPSTLVLAIALAALPGRRAARLRVTQVLRAE